MLWGWAKDHPRRMNDIRGVRRRDARSFDKRIADHVEEHFNGWLIFLICEGALVGGAFARLAPRDFKPTATLLALGVTVGTLALLCFNTFTNGGATSTVLTAAIVAALIGPGIVLIWPHAKMAVLAITAFVVLGAGLVDYLRPRTSPAPSSTEPDIDDL